MQPMNRGDLLVRQHGLSLYEPINAPTRWMFFSRWQRPDSLINKRLINEDFGGSLTGENPVGKTLTVGMLRKGIHRDRSSRTSSTRGRETAHVRNQSTSSSFRNGLDSESLIKHPKVRNPLSVYRLPGVGVKCVITADHFDDSRKVRGFKRTLAECLQFAYNPEQ
jgi:hypothetical protein